MAITFQLVERTPYTLRYLATSAGAQTAAGESGTIPNTGTGTPDLGGDADSAGEPILRLVDTAVASQAAARQLLNGDGLTVGGTDANLTTRLRGRLTVMPRSGASADTFGWAVDANASGGRAVVNVFGPNVAGATAYIEVHARHSIER